ncbi:hypothetical protein WN55_08160 [Dufourea novaeangliae]|uniref:Uncharacterized protein n=1 Tax=Dufourea novaeangliae TaxID=178035 RepID=A0A154P4Q8_DUFNO|nr:hypothetical protein WN55_08160 [Dufourea novaeangliae]
MVTRQNGAPKSDNKSLCHGVPEMLQREDALLKIPGGPIDRERRRYIGSRPSTIDRLNKVLFFPRVEKRVLPSL